MAKDAFRYAHERRDDVVWMSQNTNHLATPPAVRRALEESVEAREYNYYPYSRGVFGLPDLILEDLGLDADAWEPSIHAGALEALYFFNRAVLEPGDEVIASDPSFMPIHTQVQLAGAKPVELPIYREPWRLTVDQVAEAVTDRTRVLLLIDPLNPLGTEYPREAVRGMAELAEDHDLLLVHDITYHDFAYEPTLAGEFAPERTVYAYSFSKNAGFAGLRLGALIAPPHVMESVRPVMTNVLGTNVLAQRAGKAALETKDAWLPGVLEASRGNQAMIKEMVDELDGAFLPVYPSSANMFVIDVDALGVDPGEVERKLLYDHDVFVRGGAYLSERFGRRFVRVSFTVDPAGCQRFVDAFPAVVAELSDKA